MKTRVEEENRFNASLREMENSFDDIQKDYQGISAGFKSMPSRIAKKKSNECGYAGRTVSPAQTSR